MSRLIHNLLSHKISCDKTNKKDIEAAKELLTLSEAKFIARRGYVADTRNV